MKKIIYLKFQLYAAPIDFRALKESHKYFETPRNFRTTGNLLYYALRDCVSYSIIYTFARTLVYPGSAALLNKLIQSFLIDNRRKLIVEKV